MHILLQSFVIYGFERHQPNTKHTKTHDKFMKALSDPAAVWDTDTDSSNDSDVE